MNLAYKYPTIFWDCANLIVDSGAIENIEGKSANYNKIANVVNKIKTTTDIDISLVDINKSELSFTPDAKNNIIYYGMAGIQGIGNDVIKDIIEKRPYKSFDDFLDKTNFNKTVVTMLIKSGAFDGFGERSDIMKEYIDSVCEKKQKLTLSNFNGLIEMNLIPEELSFQKRLFVFNKALKKNCKQEEYFNLDKANYYKFYSTFFDTDELESIGNNSIGILQKKWKKMYDKQMVPAKDYLKSHQEEMLTTYNSKLFDEMWNKYAQGSYSTWEIASIGTYYNPHELANLDEKLYEIAHFKDLPKHPQIEYKFKRNGNEIPIFKTYRIAGAVISKDDLHSSIMILTNDNTVVQVKMTKDYYAKYNKRISEKQPDGTKKIVEPGFLQRGTLVVLNGYRREQSFVLKRYKKTKSHQLYKITQIYPDGKIDMTNNRADEIE